MKTYRKNAVMAGVLYFLGTALGILSGPIGGEVLTSLHTGKLLAGVDMLGLVAANSSRITRGAFFTLMMGISLVAMTGIKRAKRSTKVKNSPNEPSKMPKSILVGTYLCQDEGR